MKDYLDLQGLKVQAEHQGAPNADRLLIFAPNHHVRKNLIPMIPRSTTMESLNMVALTAVGAFDLELTHRHTAWVIKRLGIPKFGIGSLARRVQNSAVCCYGQIPVDVERKLVFKNGRFKFKEWSTNRDEFTENIVKNVKKPNNIGFFPEQKPTYELQLHHPNFPRFIQGLQVIGEEFQIVTVSNFYEGNVAHTNYGQPLVVNRDSNPSLVAKTAMMRMAVNMPKKLRGAYL